MGSVVDAPLGTLWRDADPETLVAFVADFCEARGWTVERRGDGRLLISSPEGETRLGVVHPADRDSSDLADWADTVVRVDAGEYDDSEVIGPATIRQQLAHALDRPVARELLDDHFDWTPENADAGRFPVVRREKEDDEPGDASGEETPHPIPSRGGVRSVAGSLPWPFGSRLVLAGLVLLVVGGVAVGLADQSGRGGASLDAATDATATPSTPTPTPTPASGQRAERLAEEMPTRKGGPAMGTSAKDRFERLPPGISGSGAIDADALSDAHAARLENRSYRLTLTYREFVDGRPAGLHTETIRVVNATRYTATVSERGTVRSSKFSIAETDVYADGEFRYERINESTVDRGLVLPYDRFRDDYRIYLLWFLNARASTVVDRSTVDGTRTFYVVTSGNPDPTVVNTTGSVVVTEDGLVRRARWSYEVGGRPDGYGNLSATVTLRVSDVGRTRVQEPTWVNRTAW